jgi:hypothetical protein
MGPLKMTAKLVYFGEPQGWSPKECPRSPISARQSARGPLALEMKRTGPDLPPWCRRDRLVDLQSAYTHCQRRKSLLNSLLGLRDARKTSRKPLVGGMLVCDFPGFPAAFPAVHEKFAHYGQNLQDLIRQVKKFAAKFPAPGNFVLPRFWMPPSRNHVQQGVVVAAGDFEASLSALDQA